MAFAQRLELRQGQALVMTPQLQQAIKLLQLSNIELQAYVEEELEKNPLLERDDREPVADERHDDPPNDNEAAFEALDTGLENVYADEAQADTQLRKAADAGASSIDWSKARSGGRGFDEDSGDLEGSLTRELSLRDHLSAQLATAIADPGDRLIASYIIDLVDEAGYVPADLGDAPLRLGVPLAHVEFVLARLQGFEPTGVCARSLAECLAAQLRERNRLDPAMAALLEHLPLLAKRDLMGLMRICGVDADDLAEMISEIKALNPKPGLAFSTGEATQPVVPDIFVRLGQDGSWAVELNTDTLPRVLVNQRYYAEVARSAKKRDDKGYLSECLMNANWLVKSLDQRAKTILKVASEIVRHQDGFLVNGVQHLRPLNLKTIADAISMHESTVSRVTSNKYMATTRGVFELKYFFTSSIASADGGEAHSAEAVRHRIRELIEAERASEVLSDDRIVEILKVAGIDIARRTVAKYREAMRIPSSVDRRRAKQMAG